MLNYADAQKAIREAVQGAAVKGKTALDVVREQAPDNLQLHATARQHLLGAQRPDAILRNPQASSIATALTKRLQSAGQGAGTQPAASSAVKHMTHAHGPKLLASGGRSSVLDLRTAPKNPARAMGSAQRADVGRVQGAPVTDDASRYHNLAGTLLGRKS